MAHVLEGKSIGSDQKIVQKGELLIWRTKSQARDQGTSFQDLELSIDLCLVPSKYIELHKFERQKSFTLVEAVILNKYKRK